jgi:sensor histidine kinase YesM
MLETMRKTIYIVFIFLITSCSNKQFYNYSNDIFDATKTRYKIGDKPEWKLLNFDDSTWSNEWDLPIKENIFYARKTITLKKENNPIEPIGVTIQSFGAYETYWDGVLIGLNGTPGKETKENKEGNSRRSFLIPDSLATKGKHILALRSSQFFLNSQQRVMYAYVGDYYTIVREQLITTLYINILAGAFLIAAIYYFFLFINDRKNKAMLIFGATSFLFFLLIIAEYIKFYIPIHYTDYYFRLKIIGFLTFFVSFLIPYYFGIQFQFQKRNVFLLVYFFLLLFFVWHNFYEYDTMALRFGQAMWFSSFLIIINAIYKRKKGAIVILIGLILSFIVYKLSIYDISLFVSFAIILLCMFYLLSTRTREQRIAYENSLVQSTRLKLELLKKSIQPHFLMNTLTSLIDWVEEAPDKGVLFIEALAEEFDVLNQVENETLIPITQEIKLCKSHISIMKFRKEIDYIWEDEGINEHIVQEIPPAVLHTLLENSITHCLPSDENKMRFKLIAFTTAKTQEYTFLTFGKVRNQQKSTSDGTGFKYIKARLTESYGNDWVFTSELTHEGWKNTITIQK